MNLMEIATTSGTTRRGNGYVDPRGSGRLVGLSGPVSFTDNYTCHLCGKETNRDTNPRQNHTATLSRHPTPPTPGTAGGEVIGDTAILNPATITDHPPYDIHAPTFSAAELGWSISFLLSFTLVWSTLSSISSIQSYLSALMLSLTYLFPPVTTPWVGWQLADA